MPESEKLNRLPLNALRAFEAAGRHVSFKQAATELGVTPGAVSQHIQRLELDLGRPLFVRRPSGIALTAAGEDYHRAVSAAFRQLVEATRRLMPQASRTVLTVSVAPLFAASWLLPRLPRFTVRRPEIAVRLSADLALADFAADGVDIAVRHGLGTWPGLASDLLFTVELFPVCSPALLAGGPPLAAPADLARHTLLHDASCDDWRLWLEPLAVAGVDAGAGIVFSNGPLAVAAAVEGLGVALAPSRLIERELEAGRLVRPLDLAMPAGFAYYVVCPAERRREPAIAAMRAFLLEEAKSGPGPVG